MIGGKEMANPGYIFIVYIRSVIAPSLWFLCIPMEAVVRGQIMLSRRTAGMPCGYRGLRLVCRKHSIIGRLLVSDMTPCTL